jgi:tRNA(Ile)-lysidine synthase
LPRLHPDLAAVRSAVRSCLSDLRAPELVLVGLSGGADSVALCAAVSFVAPRAGLRWGAVVVDHGLQAGSAAVARTAADQAGALGADVVEVITVAVDGNGGPEAAARDARRAALRKSAERTGAVAVLLAHTLDDQAETVLLGLARGSGARSLAGMRARDGIWRRPLLGIEATRTRAVCTHLGLECWDDPQNADPSFARVRVRRHLLPELERHLGPGVSSALARSADLLRDDADLLDRLAADLLGSASAADGSLDVRALAQAPVALRSRALRTAALNAGCPATDLAAAHVHSLDRLVTAWHGQAGVDLPGGVVARRVAGAIHLRRRGMAG